MRFGRPSVPSPKGVATAAALAASLVGCAESPHFEQETIPEQAALTGELNNSTLLVGDRVVNVEVKETIAVDIELNGCQAYADGRSELMSNLDCEELYISLGSGEITYQVGDSETLAGSIYGGIDLVLDNAVFENGRKKVEVYSFVDTVYENPADPEDEGLDYVILTGDNEIDDYYKNLTNRDGEDVMGLPVGIEMRLNDTLDAAEVIVSLGTLDIASIPVEG